MEIFVKCHLPPRIFARFYGSFPSNYREQLFNFQLDLDLKTHMRKHLLGVERLFFKITKLICRKTGF